MLSSRTFHWHTAGVCVVPAAAAVASLFIGGVANSAPPGGVPQAVEAIAAAATTTMLTASPMSPVAQGNPVTLTATVTPAAVGTVQFKDGTTNLGNPVTVSNDTALGSVSMLTAGSHQLTAVFTPTDPAFRPSTSSPVTVMITAPAGATTTNMTTNMTMTTNTALSVSPAATVAQSSPVTLTATITPATAAGTVQFKDGTTNLGNPVIVSNGAASGTTSTLTVGSHQLTAVFTPSSPAFSPSMSSPVPLTVTGSGGGSLEPITPQQSGLALGVRVSILDDRTSNLGGGLSVLDVPMPVLDGRGAVLDGRLSVLDGHGLLGGVVTVVLGQR